MDGVTIPSIGDALTPPTSLGEQLHATRNELTKARLVIDLLSQRLGVPRTDAREPHYEWLLEAVEDLRERCGEVEKP